MKEKVRIAHYGCGKMGAIAMKYALQKGGELVAAFDGDPRKIGKDAGELIGCGELGVIVHSSEDADKILAEKKPHICMIATKTLITEIKDIMMICAKNGVNAVTLSEESLYPWNSSPRTTKEIDEMAKKNNCTICGSGYQDICYGSLITTTASAVHRIDKIKLLATYNLEDYGIGVAQFTGAGLSTEEFKRKISDSDEISEEERALRIENEEYFPSFMWNVNGWIAAKIGLTVIKQTQRKNPTLCSEDLESETLGQTIKKGEPTGMSAIVTTETAEGIILESEIQGKVYGPSDKNITRWYIYGDADTVVDMAETDNVAITCGVMVNRIPDVINATAGFVTTDTMPTEIYRVKPLNEYVNS